MGSDRQTPAKVVGFWIFKMEKMYGALFSVLEVPNLKIKKPTWFHQPSAMTVFAVVLLSYFMVTGGIIYDVIVEPPSIGSTTDERGHSRPVAFMPYRVNDSTFWKDWHQVLCSLLEGWVMSF